MSVAAEKASAAYSFASVADNAVKRPGKRKRDDGSGLVSGKEGERTVSRTDVAKPSGLVSAVGQRKRVQGSKHAPMMFPPHARDSTAEKSEMVRVSTFWSERSVGEQIYQGNELAPAESEPMSGMSITSSHTSSSDGTILNFSDEGKSLACDESLDEDFQVTPPTSTHPPPTVDTPMNNPNFEAQLASHIQTMDQLKYHFEMLLQAETRYPRRSDFLDCLSRQPQISWTERAVLIDWMSELCEAYVLRRETFALALQYVDQLLSCRLIHRDTLQLVGSAALWIACKLEEVSYPPKREFLVATISYTEKEMNRMEMSMLMALQWRLHVPTVFKFLWPSVLSIWPQSQQHLRLFHHVMFAVDMLYLFPTVSALQASEVALAALWYVAKHSESEDEFGVFRLEIFPTLSDATPLLASILQELEFLLRYHDVSSQPSDRRVIHPSLHSFSLGSLQRFSSPQQPLDAFSPTYLPAYMQHVPRSSPEVDPPA
jgi:hypothetical protein